MKVLLHVCCAPCATYSVRHLQGLGWEVSGFFYNPNIHPFREYSKRLDTLRKFQKEIGLYVIYKDDYDLEGFLRKVVFREGIRCRFCYFMRIHETAKRAKEEGFDAFSTTLLISPYQEHNLLVDICNSVREEIGISFLYEDLRCGYKESIRMSKEMGLYRQSYCGCIYSEKERYCR
jgi:hypothetical protein